MARGCFVLANVLFSALACAFDLNSWSVGDGLAASKFNHAAGFDESSNTIWLLGGHGGITASLQKLSFDTNTDEFDNTHAALPVGLIFWSRGYVQRNGILYLLAWDNQIHTFDLSNENIVLPISFLFLL